MPKLKSEPVRIDSPSTHGWQVRFYYQEDDKVKYHSKLFSDGVYGSKAKAYKAAIAYRDKVYPRYANAYRDRSLEPYRRADRRNNSGVPGIMFYAYTGKRGARMHVRGHIQDKDNRLLTKTLSLHKHGARAAVKAVCRFRYNGLRKLHGRTNPYPSWQRLYNEVVAHVGEAYNLKPIKEPRR